MMQIKIQYIYIIFALLLMLLAGYALGALLTKKTVVVRGYTPDNPAAVTSVNLLIDYGNGTVKNWSTISWHESMSVMDLIDQVGGVGAIRIEHENINGDKRVESIDDVKNDATQGLRWQYWINNTYEPRIASKYYLKPGDQIVLIYTKEKAQ